MTQEVSVPKWVRTIQIGIGSLVIILSILAVAIPKIGPFMSIALIAVTLSIVGIENIFTGITVPSSKKSRIISIVLGAAILGFGIFTISNPEASLKFLILIIGIALLINGIVRILSSRSNKSGKKGNQIIKLATGIVSIALGIFVLAAPEIGFIILVIAIVIALVIQGIEIITSGIRGKKYSIFRT
jgi:uncharacterized membrane protein HdeD (DUF308 family)